VPDRDLVERGAEHGFELAETDLEVRNGAGQARRVSHK
jgi:hypothetical protein